MFLSPFFLSLFFFYLFSLCVLSGSCVSLFLCFLNFYSFPILFFPFSLSFPLSRLSCFLHLFPSFSIYSFFFYLRLIISHILYLFLFPFLPVSSLCFFQSSFLPSPSFPRLPFLYSLPSIYFIFLFFSYFLPFLFPR